MIPAIDRHGAIQPTRPLTARALTGVLARRHNATALHAATAVPANRPARPARPAPPLTDTPMRHRPGRDDHAKLERLWEQAEEAADELNARILQLLADL